MTSLNEIRGRLTELSPLIHCITNPISINQCANAILAVGARPMMAEHPDEAAVITRSAGALMLNLGNFTDVRAKSMVISAATAKEHGIPFILDVCGAACLPNRREYALNLAKQSTPTVIKGNRPEITALYDNGYSTSGVDGDSSLSLEKSDAAAAALAKKLGCIVLASGAADTVTDGTRLTHLYNGTPRLGSITGTGCMQGALCAAFLAVCGGYEAAVCACVLQGICGELCEDTKGSGSFAAALMDGISTVTDDDIIPRLRMEEINIEDA